MTPNNSIDRMVVSDLIDSKLITAHIKTIHDAARGISGKLVLASFGQNPVTGEKIVTKVRQFLIGDSDIVSAMAKQAARWAAEDHRNVHVPLAVQKLGITGRGGNDDYSHSLGAVADFDDHNAADYLNRLPLAPRIVIASSEGRFQCVYLFTKPVSLDVGADIGRRLVEYSGCDHCTATAIHVWRVLGTLNWPNEGKVDKGRSRTPQQVTIISKGECVDAEVLRESMPPVAAKTQAAGVAGFIQPPADVEQVQEALALIPANLPYGEWVRVLAALHSEGLRDLAAEWSKLDPRFNQREFDDKWRSFSPNNS